MAKLRVRYFVRKKRKGARSKDGAPYYANYWQPKKDYEKYGFKTVRLSDSFVEAVEQAERLNLRLDAARSGLGSEDDKYGTMPWLINLYKKSHEYGWPALADKTKKDYEYCFRVIRSWSERAGNPHISLITKKAVKSFYRFVVEPESDAPKFRKANLVLNVLKKLFNIALDEEVDDIVNNPVRGLKMSSGQKRKEKWSDEQFSKFLLECEKEKLLSLAAIACLCREQAMRAGDARNLLWSDYDGAYIRYQTSKTSVKIHVPVSERTKKYLDRLPKIKEFAILYEGTGQPYSLDLLSKISRKIMVEAGIPGSLQIRDLRRTSLTELAESGATEDEIIAFSGHKSREVVSTYVVSSTDMARRASQKRSAMRKSKGKLDA